MRLHPGGGNQGDDIEKGRLSSMAERSESIVSMSDFDGLDEYTALQKYITNYRDPESAATADSDAQVNDSRRSKRWWKFWRGFDFFDTGSTDPGAVPYSWLNTDIKHGLSKNKVDSRRARVGFNEITTEENMLRKFFGYFTGPVSWVMEITALLAASLQEWIAFGVICGIILLNAVAGWYQEKQAADAVARLEDDIAMKATVIRDGKQESIQARELVPGDITIIEEGQTVPADVRLICDFDSPQDFETYVQMMEEVMFEHSPDSGGEKQDNDQEEEENIVAKGQSVIAIDQSILTGESLSVPKYMGDIAYFTTGCKRGKAYAIVITSARTSFIGRHGSVVEDVKDRVHFNATMNSIGTALLVLAMFFILAAWIGCLFRLLKIATASNSFENILHYALILLIIGVPIGLPLAITTSCAGGAIYLATQNAIVRNVTVFESLAGVDVLCCGKTGTLTADRLSIREPYVAEGQDMNWMLAVAVLASSHDPKSFDSIDKATILTIKRYPKAREILNQGWRTEKFTPFDPVSSRITAVCYMGGHKYVCTKGVPNAILKLSDCNKVTESLFRNKLADLARRGFRCLGVAYQKNDGPWILLGLLPMFDLPREDAAQSIAEAQQLGISVKMLTCEGIAIAQETCKMLALGTKVYNAQKLFHGGLIGSTQHEFVERADGFAELFPVHKYQIVEMLQQRGHLTAVIGDGVNDAPALKKADCRIAVKGASEAAAQGAADIITLTPGLSTSMMAIKTAREIFQRMKAYIQHRIALCLHLEIYLVLSMIILEETIRVELVVFIDLFADLTAVAVAHDNAYPEGKPVRWRLPKIWIISVVLGILLTLGTGVLRGMLFLPNGGVVQSFGSVQEILFLEVSLTESWLIFVTRGGKTCPSFQLFITILGVDTIATVFCLFGWLSGGLYHTDSSTNWHQHQDGRADIVTVVVIWAYSLGVTFVMAVVFYLLNRIKWLDELGRKNVPGRDPTIENTIAALSKLALVREVDKFGTESYVFEQRATDEEGQ